MTVTLIFLALLMAVVVGWLFKQTLNTQPWAEQSVVGEEQDSGAFAFPSKKIGLGIFLAVATSLFSLFVSAYFMRMHHSHDWTALTEPKILWINTIVLVLASVFFQRARNAAQRSEMRIVRSSLFIGGALTFAFLAGQLWAWQQLNALGYFLTSNPANAFFYVLTGVHGLHLLGGLCVWTDTMGKVLRGVEMHKIRGTVELCTIYWHFLLIIWAALLALLLVT